MPWVSRRAQMATSLRTNDDISVIAILEKIMSVTGWGSFEQEIAEEETESLATLSL